MQSAIGIAVLLLVSVGLAAESGTEQVAEAEFANPNCTTKLAHMMNHFLTDPTLETIFSYTGKGMNDIGDYWACKQDPNHYYALVSIFFNGLFMFRMGLCPPIECPIDLVKTYARPYIAQLASAITHSNIRPGQVSILDTAAGNRELAETSETGAAIFLAALALLLCLGIVATLSKFQVLSSFDLCANLRSLFGTQNRIDPRLEVLNGLRVLSMAWVISGHSFFLAFFRPIYNPRDFIHDVLEEYYTLYVKGATLAVDVFLLLGGFLAALGTLRGFSRSGASLKTIALAYFHRYVRLLPILAFGIMYTSYIQPVLYDTPFTQYSLQGAQRCKDQWGYMLLYVNNFTTDMSTMCNGWVWYLFIDFQIFFFMPFWAMLYRRSKSLGLAAAITVCAASILLQTWIGVHYELNQSTIGMKVKGDANKLYYSKPYCRVVPYCIGVIMFVAYDEQGKEGSVLSKAKNLIVGSWVARYGLYVFGGVLAYLAAYSFHFLDKYPSDWGTAFGVFQLVCARPAFVLGIALAIIYPVLCGKGQVLLSTLGHPLFNVMGKLTYGAYMMHVPILTILYISALQGEFYTPFDVVMKTAGVFCAGYLLSLGITLVCESPVARLLSLLDARDGNNKKPGANLEVKKA